MGQKINPISLRLQTTNRHFDNCWYSNYFYKKLITKDLLLTSYLNSFLKRVKLPTGRYSIHHFQKKTRISSFFCFSKSTREWRSHIFGLSKKKKFPKKSRFFFKVSSKFKRKRKKVTGLFQFSRSLSQKRLYKIQKRITSFQNFHLWSSVFQTHQNSRINGIHLNLLKQTPQKFTLPKMSLENSISSAFSKKEVLFKNLQNLSSLEKKNHQVEKNTNQNFSLMVLKNETPPFHKEADFEKRKSGVKRLFQKSTSFSNLLFLQNLMVYTFLKSPKRGKSLGEKWKVDQGKNLLVLSRNPKFKAFNLKYSGYLESHLSGFLKHPIDLQVFKLKNDWQNASYLAEEIVYLLEKRLPFRRLKSKLVKQFSKIEQIQGVRITCSGRVGGKSKKAQRSKVECLKYGQTSLHVFSSKIDFAEKTAFTSFGSVGVKVWICYN